MVDMFSTVKLGKRAVLANRLAVAPMTTTQSHADGQVSEAETAWLERLAGDGYGMVITCAAAVSRQSIAFPNQMNLGDDRYLPGLTALATKLNAYPALAVVQLCHGGSRAIVELTGEEAKSASAYDAPMIPGFVRPREFTPTEIAHVVTDFADAASRAAQAGFAGIELHGANGYLFTQFISRMTNLRTDSYGGSLGNRARFSREVVRACRAKVPGEFLIGFRMTFEGGPWDTGLDIDENIQIMNWLAEDGIDYGHISHMVLTSPSVKYPDKIALSLIRSGVSRALPLVAAGGVMSTADVERALELGADVVAVGRAAIGNARVPSRLARRELLTHTPFDPTALAAIRVSPDFVHYLTSAGPLSRMNIVQSGATV